MPKTPHIAFKQDNAGHVNSLVTEAEVFPASDRSQSISVRALWDTGAMGSVITPKILKALNLTPFNRILVYGVNNTSIADVVKISVGLPNKIFVDDINATVCDLTPGIDMLIGMDIIVSGDFAISNAGGQTLFTFAIPPFENKIDLYAKALASSCP
jgi:predicted aspartyl protease